MDPLVDKLINIVEAEESAKRRIRSGEKRFIQYKKKMRRINRRTRLMFGLSPLLIFSSLCIGLTGTDKIGKLMDESVPEYAIEISEGGDSYKLREKYHDHPNVNQERLKHLEFYETIGAITGFGGMFLLPLSYGYFRSSTSRTARKYRDVADYIPSFLGVSTGLLD